MTDVSLEFLGNLTMLVREPADNEPALNLDAQAPQLACLPDGRMQLPDVAKAQAPSPYSRESSFQRMRALVDSLSLGALETNGREGLDDELYAACWEEPPANWSDHTICLQDDSFAEAFARSGLSTAFAIANDSGCQAYGLLPDQELTTSMQVERGLPPWVSEQLSELAMAGTPVLPVRRLVDRIFWAPGVDTSLSQLRCLLQNALPKEITHVILAPWLDSGGAELLVLWHAKAVHSEGGRTLVLGTDASKNRWSGLLPDSACYINLPDLLSENGFGGRFSADNIADCLAITLSEIPLRTLHVINSYVGYRLLGNRLGWSNRRIFVSLFGIGRDDLGLEAGYWFEARNLRDVDLFLTDNKHLPDSRGSGFGLSPDRLYPIYYPAEATLKHRVAKQRAVSHAKRILWASRLDAEKLPNLVFDIARLMPEVEFHMFGRPVLDDCSLSDPPANVALRGPFDGWNSLPYEPFDCFLFTSRWEGMPNIILEAMGSGLPIVSSRVGAIPEALEPSRGWLIDDVLNPNAYAEVLRFVLGDPVEAERRSNLAFMNIIIDRSFDSFLKQLRDISYV